MSEWRFDNGAELLSRSIPPQRWIIDDLLPEGLTLLCGSPKAGKSWLSLDIALHVASGQPFWGHRASSGRVLLFALEDGERRLKRRLEMLLEGHEELNPALIYPCFSVPPLESGFASGLESQLQDFGSGEKVAMVIVDTLGKVREPSRLDGYQRDYQQVAALKTIADKHHIAILVVHHLRKMGADDPFDRISGTQGILGAADGAMVLMRQSRSERSGKLYLTSRDSDDKQYALNFDDNCRWNLLSPDAEEFDFMHMPLVCFLQQLAMPWTGFTTDLHKEYTAFCVTAGIDAGLSVNTPAAIGKQLSAIAGELWRLRLSYCVKHTAKGNLIEISKI